MKQSSTVVRDYIKSDDKLIEQSQVISTTFMEHETEFSDAFTDLASPFGTEWETLNQEAVITLTDVAIADRLQVITDEVNKSLLQAIDLYQIIMVYARIAYSNDRAKLKAFGSESYGTAKRSQVKMIKLLTEMYDTINLPQVKPVLLAKGLKQTQIDSLNQLLLEINGKNRMQEKYKNDRLVLTQERIMKYNELWRRMSLVCEAAKVVFRNNPAMLRIFRLYPENPSNTENPTEPSLVAFAGLVSDSENNEMIEMATVEIEALKLSDITDEDGEFYIDQIPIGTYNIKVTAEGYQQYNASVTIPADGLLSYEVLLVPTPAESLDNPA